MGMILSEIVNYTLMMENVQELSTSKLMVFNQAGTVQNHRQNSKVLTFSLSLLA